MRAISGSGVPDCKHVRVAENAAKAAYSMSPFSQADRWMSRISAAHTRQWSVQMRWNVL